MVESEKEKGNAIDEFIEYALSSFIRKEEESIFNQLNDLLSLAYYKLWDDMIQQINKLGYILENEPIMISCENIDWTFQMLKKLRIGIFTKNNVKIILSLNLFDNKKLFNPQKKHNCVIPISFELKKLVNDDFEKNAHLIICYESEYPDLEKSIKKQINSFLC